MKRQFQIIYTGKFNYKSSLNATAANLALILDTSPESALNILKQRKSQILFTNVSIDNVRSLVSNLEDVGLIIDAVEISSTQKSYQANTHQSNTIFGGVSGPYKVFMIAFAVISTSLLILVLSYLFASS
jgi:hypothetical protein